jgi:hypothetical protein
MGRPLGSFKGRKRAIVISFSVSGEYAELLREAEKRARVEGCSRSDIMLEALKEYFRYHDQPNPQTQLPVNKPLAQTISLGRALRTMERLLSNWENAKDSGKFNGDRANSLMRLEENIEKMAAVYDRTKDEQLKGYIEKAMQILKDEGRL